MELKLVKRVEWRIEPVGGEYLGYQPSDYEHLQEQFEEMASVLQEGKILGNRTQVPPSVAMRVSQVILENYRVERRKQDE